MTSTTLQNKDSAVTGVLYMAFELSDKQWKLAMSDGGEKRRMATVTSGDLMGLEQVIGEAKARFRLSSAVRIVSCFEAGRDGFWLHHALVHRGVENVVVDSSSIETSRRARRAKTDRLDAMKLLTMLIRYAGGGERGLWSVLHVPSVEDEDARRLHRESQVLQRERTEHRNRLRSLLITQGLRLEPGVDFPQRLEALRCWDGRAVPEELKAMLVREYERLRLVEAQYAGLEQRRMKRVKEAATQRMVQIARLMQLKAIGIKCAWLLVMEFFAWRYFRNRRELAACAGLTGTPYDSGNLQRDQGISKAGNRRVRAMMVEIAWLWVGYQPESRLSRRFIERFAQGGSRLRRVGIVALARKLLVALWQYLEHGVLPEGAVLTASR